MELGAGDEGNDTVLADFSTYEEYLSSKIQDADLKYLGDSELAKQLVELGYRGSGETLKREEFEARKQAELANDSQKASEVKQLASANCDLSEYPFLHALAIREELVRAGKLTSIIFIRDVTASKQEVSGYIDYAHRLKTENFEPYFQRKKKLMPKVGDLNCCAKRAL